MKAKEVKELMERMALNVKAHEEAMDQHLIDESPHDVMDRDQVLIDWNNWLEQEISLHGMSDLEAVCFAKSAAAWDQFKREMDIEPALH